MIVREPRDVQAVATPAYSNLSFEASLQGLEQDIRFRFAAASSMLSSPVTPLSCSQSRQCIILSARRLSTCSESESSCCWRKTLRYGSSARAMKSCRKQTLASLTISDILQNIMRMKSGATTSLTSSVMYLHRPSYRCLDARYSTRNL